MAHADLSIVLAGEAGQGIQSIEGILIDVLKGEGLHVYATKEYMSRVRGGMNSTSLRVGSRPVAAFVERIDVLVPLAAGAIAHLGDRVTDKTIVIGDAQAIGHPGMLDVPLKTIGKELGSPVYAGMAAAGVLCALLGVPAARAAARITERFGRKGDAALAGNQAALERGYTIAAASPGHWASGPDLPRDPDVADRILVDGSDAVALGAIAGGCDYACAYPMSPGTGVLTALAGYSKQFDILVEQVEDEVGVINMALGAWYAGARALVTTSGGGFALMTEGVSLAGMIETPVVVHIAQRPGPATGLPTRTEQGDLNLVLYAGHGHFPRAIYAPGDLGDAFQLTQLAFDVADRAQSPVFILTDQYLVDTYYDTAPFDADAVPFRRHTVRTEAAYLRYKLTDDGISPRGIPGDGDGLVCVDSDEHDESGHITEDLDLRVKMVDKRLAKGKLLAELAVPPRYRGPDVPATTIVCWGSTKNAVYEAVIATGDATIGVLHFPQVYPLPAMTKEILESGGRLIIVENNSDAAFANLLAMETGVRIERRILKYSGLPFSVEELAEKISAHAKGA